MSKKKDYVIKDSGERRKFETGAQRDIVTGKGRYDLLPLTALMNLSVHFEKGCEKYGDRNWEKGIPISVLINSGERHIAKFIMGLEDEEHLIAAIWNFIVAKDVLNRIKLGVLPESLDDLPYTYRNVDEDKLKEMGIIQ